MLFRSVSQSRYWIRVTQTDGHHKFESHGFSVVNDLDNCGYARACNWGAYLNQDRARNLAFFNADTRFVFSYEAFISATFVIPDPSRCWGIDISHWNGIVDLSKAKAEGCSFVIIKGCDGSIPTINFQQNRDNAKQNGLLWGVYDWLYRDANVNTTTQTNAWWKQVQSDYPPLGVYIDFEWTKYNGVESNPTSADLKLALGKFKVLSGKNAGIYVEIDFTFTSYILHTDDILKYILVCWPGQITFT